VKSTIYKEKHIQSYFQNFRLKMTSYIYNIGSPMIHDLLNPQLSDFVSTLPNISTRILHNSFRNEDIIYNNIYLRLCKIYVQNYI